MHASLPRRPPIVECDKETGSSQEMAMSVVEGGTSSVDDRGIGLWDGGCAEVCIVCCED